MTSKLKEEIKSRKNTRDKNEKRVDIEHDALKIEKVEEKEKEKKKKKEKKRMK
ncbi:hypothetical protein [Brachyspira hyodysenteriae]|uniref:hypothetical protein n=1 Tax=Brachyspira hyodysenteriae TaxID=159 RepID=UPI0015C47A54|nr:hypothetical protein [Brachyspira hyodysenteriae]